ncbi:hypothetical protein LCGC14_1929240, partial [marine sediment metagenome]
MGLATIYAAHKRQPVYLFAIGKLTSIVKGDSGG